MERQIKILISWPESEKEKRRKGLKFHRPLKSTIPIT
jgi:hypothetical protein